MALFGGLLRLNCPDRINSRIHNVFEAVTHEGAGSRSTLLQHAPGAKLPRLHQRFLTKNMLRNKTFAPEFFSLISNWFDMCKDYGNQVATKELFSPILVKFKNTNTIEEIKKDH